jgi:predicted 3-demethylubiquinone-9 3-methyltransferase (glyoxalase superfamily)
MQKITPFLWFNDNAEEAMDYYTSVFKNSKKVDVSRYGESGPGPKGSVMSVMFELEGQMFYALNGGPAYTLTPAFSMFVDCKTQEEVDYYWEKLSEGGRKDRCGWLTDRFGLSWQIVPSVLTEMLRDPDPARAARVMKAMLKMDKLIIKDLEAAYGPR